MDQTQSPSHMDSGQPASSEGYYLLIVSPQVNQQKSVLVLLSFSF